MYKEQYKYGGKVMGQLSATEKPLNNIFSSDYTFYIPPYQRPYSWTENESKELFKDLYGFYIDNKAKEPKDRDSYFLGSVVLIKQEHIPKSEVIDGQQRLTTLTILWSAIVSRLTGDAKAEEMKRLMQPGEIARKIPKSPRLTLREQDQLLFRKYIQEVDPNGIKLLNIASLKESQQHIIKNYNILSAKLDEYFINELDLLDFCGMLLDHCYVVVVCAANQKTAFKIFSVMNNRGMDLLPIDILKSDIIGTLTEYDRDKYTKLWEDTESDLSRDKFNFLFGHIRMIYAKMKAKDSLYDEFNKYVLVNYKNNYKKFIDDILIPYADAYEVILNKNYQNIKQNEAQIINNYLYWLNKIDNSDWVPLAMELIKQKESDAKYLCFLFKKLECLATYMHVTAKDVNDRIMRYSKIISELQQIDSNIDNPINSINLANKEIREFKRTLAGDIYSDLNSKRRNYLILRIDAFVSNGAASYETGVLTIEHVLPQTVNANSEWEKLWVNENDRIFWLNKLANLVPLARRQNSEAQNYDFAIKKDKYFKSKTGTSSYALTTQVLNCDAWTLNVVQERQKALLSLLDEEWELFETADQEDFELAQNDNDIIGNEFIISENDIRANILRNRRFITENIPDDIFTCETIVNGKKSYFLSIDKSRTYFARVTSMYKDFGLIDGYSRHPKKCKLSWDGTKLIITIK